MLFKDSPHAPEQAGKVLPGREPVFEVGEGADNPVEGNVEKKSGRPRPHPVQDQRDASQDLPDVSIGQGRSNEHDDLDVQRVVEHVEELERVRVNIAPAIVGGIESLKSFFGTR
jgi:hypothetical protein